MALTKEEKILVVSGLITAGAIAALGMASKSGAESNGKPKGYGIHVGPQCNTFEVTDAARVHDSIRGVIRSQSKKGTVDPFSVATAWLMKAAPHCQVYPSPPRNPGEAALYVETFNTVLDIMQSEKLLSTAEMFSFKQMVKVWGLGHGLNQEDF